MKEILDTILDPGSQPADFGALPVPEAYRAVTLHQDEEHMFDGLDPATGTRVSPCTWKRCRSPSSPGVRPSSP